MREWARRIPADEVSFTAMHPGWADTPGISAALPRLLPPDGSAPADARPGRRHDRLARRRPGRGRTAVTGRLFLDRRARPFDRVPTTRVSAADRRRLWDVVVGLAGVDGPGTHRPQRPRPRSNDMTRIHERIETALPLDAAFDYIADFANSAGVGSGYRLLPSTGRPAGRARRRATRLDGPDGRPRRPDGVPDPRLRASPPGRARRLGLRRRRRRRHPLRARR